MALSGEHFGTVEAECSDADEDLLAVGRLGDGPLHEFEDAGRACGGYDDCVHGRHFG